MNIETKKTIAKEIIYFFSVIAMLLIIFLGIEIRNTFLNNKKNNFSKEISILKVKIDSIEKKLPKEVNKKPKFDEYGILIKNVDYFNILGNTMHLKKTDREKLDNIMLKMINNNESDENKKLVVNDFIQKYGIKKTLKLNKALEKLEKTKTETSQKLQITENKIVNINETKNIVFWCTIVFFVLLYPFRFIFNLLKWSFKIIKNKD